MKVCPKCKRIYEDAKRVCPHDNTPLQVKAATQKPVDGGESAYVQNDRETRSTILPGLGGIVVLILLLAIGGSPWSGVNPPSPEVQAGTAVAVNEQPSSSAPVQPKSGEAQVAREQDPLMDKADPKPETAKAEPEPEKAVTAEEPGSAPEPQAAAEESVPTPERSVTTEESATEPEQEATTEEPTPTPEPQKSLSGRAAITAPAQRVATEESVPMPEQPEQRATTKASIIKPEPEKRVTAQKSVRIAGQEKKPTRRVPTEGRQVQSVPSGEKLPMQVRAEEKKLQPLQPLMVWIYRTKADTPLLSKARAGAPVVKQLKSGEQLRVVGSVGSYFEVRSSGEGASSAYVHPKDVTLVRIE